MCSVKHVADVKNKKFGAEFLAENNFSDNLGYVEKMFDRNLKAGFIDVKYSGIDILKVLGF